MINNTILNKYKPNVNKDLFCDKFIDHLYKSVSTFKTNGIYASYLILGNTGVGKTHFVNTIFNSVNCPFYTELKTIDLHKMKIDLKSSKKKSDDEPEIKLKKKETKEIAIKNYLQKCCGCNNLLKYMNPNNEVPTTILYLDENENNIKKPSIQKLVIEIIKVNNKYRICPIILTFIDSTDQYLKQYKNNSNVYPFVPPNIDLIKHYVNKVFTREKIKINEADVNKFCEMGNNNWGIINKNLIELINNYITIQKVQGRVVMRTERLITTESFKKFVNDLIKAKYIYDDITMSCKKSLTGKLNINDMMQLYVKEKINYPNIITHYILNNCNNPNSFKKISKIIALYNRINENIYKEQKWNLTHHYGFLTTVDMSYKFIQGNPKYQFKPIRNTIYKNHKEHNFVFYYKFNSINNLNNILLSDIICNAIKSNDKQYITDIIKNYKLEYQDIIYIIKLNKMNNNYISNSNLTVIKNIIANKNKFSIKKLKLKAEPAKRGRKKQTETVEEPEEDDEDDDEDSDDDTDDSDSDDSDDEEEI